MAAPTAALMDEINKINWWHRIDLGNGITTPGRDDSPTKLVQVNLPQSLQGLSVLDIGAWDGFFSFECERRGAKRVVALDKAVWDIPTFGREDSNSLAGYSARKSKTSSWTSSTSARSELVSSTWFSSSGSCITCLTRFSPWNGS